MTLSCLVSWPGKPNGADAYPLKALPDLLKAHPEGLSRAPFFCPAGDSEGIREAATMGSLPLGGPFTVIHAIRRAGDILLEECGYDGMTIGLEVEGSKLPELPPRAELESLLTADNTMVTIDGRSYRANTEVYGFQQVYDDSVRFIDSLKSLGVPADAMSLFATPEDISIEIHPDVLGITETPALPGLYRALLGKLAGLKISERRLLKTIDKTVLLEVTRFDSELLIPGATHPGLHRAKVGVGPSHFAYGPAAFSDYCGKKRSIDECIKEVRAWIKFIETPREALPKLKDVIGKLETAVGVAAAVGGNVTEEAAAVAGASIGFGAGGYQPFGLELLSRPQVFPGGGSPLATPFAELNRTLGGGFQARGLHLIVGGREEGKAALLMNMALHFAARRGVLYLSREMTQSEFSGRLLAHLRKMPAADWTAKAATGSDGESVRKKLGEMLGEIARALPQSFFFRGSDSAVRPLDVNEIVELIKMTPPGDGNVLVLEGLSIDEAGEDFLRRLHLKGISQNFTAFVGIHASATMAATARPQFIEAADHELSARFFTVADTVLHLQSERVNLKKFLAMLQGKVDPTLAEKLEARFNAAAGNERRKSDTFAILRLLHARWGNRQAILYLYQRELARFLEGPALSLGRP
ncbi:MAG: hypothetical protein HQM09_07960 [Candidatus Riflebacteria bacterium]|nr:hypothetical protein [Candidatus Riflebacteria bacterium]